MAKPAAASSRVHIVPVETQERLWRIESKLCIWSCLVQFVLARMTLPWTKTEGRATARAHHKKKGYFPFFFRLGSDLLMGASPTRTPRRRATSTSICSSDQKLWPEIPELGSIMTYWPGDVGRVLEYFSIQVPIVYLISIPPNKCLPSNCHLMCWKIGMCHFFLTLEAMDDSRMLLGPLRVSLFEVSHR